MGNVCCRCCRYCPGGIFVVEIQKTGNNAMGQPVINRRFRRSYHFNRQPYLHHVETNPALSAGAIAILISNIIKKNGLQALLGKEISLPDAVWKKLAISWMFFLIIMGFVNLAVAYPFSAEREAVWNNYKFFGAIPLTFLFSLAQVIYLNRYLPKENKND